MNDVPFLEMFYSKPFTSQEWLTVALFLSTSHTVMED
jgi:hypothetical protein